jgi:hypothetical protein
MAKPYVSMIEGLGLVGITVPLLINCDGVMLKPYVSMIEGLGLVGIMVPLLPLLINCAGVMLEPYVSIVGRLEVVGRTTSSLINCNCVKLEPYVSVVESPKGTGATEPMKETGDIIVERLELVGIVELLVVSWACEFGSRCHAY